MARSIICSIIYVHYKHVICSQAYSFCDYIGFRSIEKHEKQCVRHLHLFTEKKIIEHIVDLGLKCQLRLDSADKDTLSHLGCFDHA